MSAKEKQLKSFRGKDSIRFYVTFFKNIRAGEITCNKRGSIVPCFGLKWNYLQQNHNNLTWKERIQITYDILHAFYIIHSENKQNSR